MKSPARTLLLATVLALPGVMPALAQKSDLTPLPQRAITVELADRLIQPRVLAEKPAEMIVPFNPVGFEQPDLEELKARQAATTAAVAAGTPVRQTGDRDVLATLAEKLSPSGILIIGGEPMLLFGQKRLKIGDRLTVTYEGADYALDVTAIARTTFTLRLNREEITRPIKSGK